MKRVSRPEIKPGATEKLFHGMNGVASEMLALFRLRNYGFGVMSDPKLNRLGLSCDFCGVPFALALGKISAGNIDDLPDPFFATCPHCEQTGSYPKSAIVILMALSRR